jgi:hypothetical protein
MAHARDEMPNTKAAKAAKGTTRCAESLDFARDKPGSLPASPRFLHRLAMARRVRTVAVSSMAPNKANFSCFGPKMEVERRSKANRSQFGVAVIRWKSWSLPGRSGRLRCRQLRQTKPILPVLGLKLRMERKNKANFPRLGSVWQPQAAAKRRLGDGGLGAGMRMIGRPCLEPSPTPAELRMPPREQSNRRGPAGYWPRFLLYSSAGGG